MKGHSCWQLLHHTVIWQETFLATLRGENIDWSIIESKHNWPTEESLQNESEFLQLQYRYNKNNREFENLLKVVDLSQTRNIEPDPNPVLNSSLLLAYLQHISYHIGQIKAVLSLI